MNPEINSSRISWRLRRGMLELDVLLHAFFKTHFAKLVSEQQLQFELLLEEQDPQIYRWLIGFEVPQDEALKSIVAEIRAFREQ